ncbi:hypothetical protein MKEN_00714100 [Mycena kentingensis (nom. inval.)]|nr:hypothetical protein MKEN_00714100 [Mycena kentingensis (nom. inval.)]
MLNARQPSLNIATRWPIVQYCVFETLGQTFVFGGYTVLFTLGIRLLLKRGLSRCINLTTFGGTVLVYVLTGAFWIYSLANAANLMREYNAHVLASIPTFSAHNDMSKWSPVWNAVVSLNFLCSDGVVVWRAWIISPPNYRKYLMLAVLFLAAMAASVVALIVVRIIVFVQFPIEEIPTTLFLAKSVTRLQTTSTIVSLLSNLAATGVVGIVAFQHRQFLRAAWDESETGQDTRVNRILRVLVKSGLIYCVCGIFMLVFSVIRLPQGTLGDIYFPAFVTFSVCSFTGSWPK